LERTVNTVDFFDVDGELTNIDTLSEDEFYFAMRTNTLLPLEGVGFKNNSIDTDKDIDKWAQPEVADFIVKFAAYWNRIHPDRPLMIGDLSRFLGGSDSPHSSHKFGMCADIGGLATWSDDLIKELAKALFNFDARTPLQKLFGVQQNVTVVRILFKENTVVEELTKLYYNMVLDENHGHYHVDWAIRDPRTSKWVVMNNIIEDAIDLITYVPYNEK
jgi:hypothetical protein